MTRRWFWRGVAPAAAVAAAAVYFVWLREPDWAADPGVRGAAEWLGSLGDARESDTITPARAARIEDIGFIDLTGGRRQEKNRVIWMGRSTLRIDVFNPNLPVAGFATLAALPKLRALRLRLPAGVGDDALAESTGRLSRLVQLQWRGTNKLTDAGIAQFGRLTNLDELGLEGESVTDARLRQLAGLTKLEVLDIRGFELGEGLSVLAGFPALRALDLDEGFVRAGGIAHLGRLAGLEGFSFENSRAEGTLAPLARLPKLKRLILNEALLDDEQFGSLAGAPAVAFVNASKVKAGRKALEAFASMPKLATLHLDDASLNEGVAGLARAPAIATLYLRRTAVGDRDGATLGALKTLTALTLEETGAGDLTAEALGGLPLLETLVMHKTRVGDEGLRHLARAPKLDTLYLGETGITDAGLAYAAKAPALRTIHLEGTKITDAGMRSLAASKTLRSVYVRNTAVTDALVDELRRSHPQLSISK